MRYDKIYLIVGVHRYKDTGIFKSVEMYEMPELKIESLSDIENKSKIVEISYDELMNKLENEENLYFVARDTAKPGIIKAITKERTTKDNAKNLLNNYLKVDSLKNHFELE